MTLFILSDVLYKTYTKFISCRSHFRLRNEEKKVDNADAENTKQIRQKKPWKLL